MAIEQVESLLLDPRGKPHYVPQGSQVTSTSRALDRQFRMKAMPSSTWTLGAGSGNTILAYWQNPEARRIILLNLIINVTDASTNACTLDIDVVANATTNADTIFNGLAINAPGVSSSWEVGSGGTEIPHFMDENGGASDFLTIYEAANQDVTSFVCTFFIYYVII